MGSNVGEGEETGTVSRFESFKEEKMRRTLESIIQLTNRPGDPSSLLQSIRTHAMFGLGNRVTR